MNYRTLLGAGAFVLAAAAASGAAEAARTTADLSVRAGPGSGFARVDVIPQGAYVDIEGCRDGWCRVDWRGRDGWSYAGYLTGSDGRDGPQYRDPGPWGPHYGHGYYDRAPYYRYGYGPRFGFRLDVPGVDVDIGRRGPWWR